MITRKNQANLTAAEWNDFIDAVNQTHGTTAGAPAYREFVNVHVRAMEMQDMEAMAWAVHTMGPMMPGRNFLAWHRRLLARFEQRLRQVHSNIALPYWDTVSSPSIPAPLADPPLLSSWSVVRHWNPAELPNQDDMNALKSFGTFGSFQRALEITMHNSVHRAVGGNMVSAASPSDPLFWLHHANIDRIWTEWQKAHPGKKPSNKSEVLQPKPLFGVKVSSVLNVKSLGYKYA